MHQLTHRGIAHRSHRKILAEPNGTFQSGRLEQRQGVEEPGAQPECKTLVQQLVRLVQLVWLVSLRQKLKLTVHLRPPLVAARLLALPQHGLRLHLMLQCFLAALDAACACNVALLQHSLTSTSAALFRLASLQWVATP